MTLPEGREPLLWRDIEFAKPVKADQFNCLSGHPSTWEQECAQLRETLSAIIAATDMSQTKHRPEVIVQIIRHLARAALQEDE